MAYSLDTTPLLTHILNIGTTTVLNIEPEIIATQQIISITKGAEVYKGTNRPTIHFQVLNGGGLTQQITWFFRTDDSAANRNTVYGKIRDVICANTGTIT